MRKKQVNYLCDGWKFVIAKEISQVEAMRQTWQEMQNNQPYPVVNADINRYLSVIKGSDKAIRPYITLLQYKEEPKGMIIGKIEEKKIIGKIGYKTVLDHPLSALSITYGGILGQIQKDIWLAYIQNLKEMLIKGEIDIIFFNHLEKASPLCHIIQKTPSLLCRDYFPVTEPHWQTRIVNNVEAFYETIRSKHKREWRRNERKLSKACNGDIKVVCYTKEDDIDYILETAYGISKLTYKHSMNIGINNNSLTREILSQSARNGWLRAYFLYIKDVPSAFEFGSYYGKSFFVEYMGYDPKWQLYGLGILLWIKVIEDLCRDPEVEILDYGFGNALYKEMLGTKCWEESSVYIFAPRIYPVIINIIRSIIQVINNILAYFVLKTGILMWLKRTWRRSKAQSSKKFYHKK